MKFGVILRTELKENLSSSNVSVGEIAFASDTDELAVNVNNSLEYRKLEYGAPGRVFKCTGLPLNSQGLDGDLYLDMTQGVHTEYYKIDGVWKARYAGFNENSLLTIFESKIDYPDGLLKRNGSVTMDAGYSPSTDHSVVTKGFLDLLTSSQGKITTDGLTPMENGYSPALIGDVYTYKDRKNVLIIPPSSPAQIIGSIWNDNGVPRIVRSVYLSKLFAPDGASEDYFGVSVAISQDNIVVGAPGDDDNGSDSGSAYIFNSDGSYVTKITAPDGDSEDYFGWSVAISGDKIVVGAYGDADNGSDSGSAYIFNSDGSFVTKITAPDGASEDYFGVSVAISQDNIVVGAPGDDDNGSYSGSVYIFNSDGSYVAKITAPDGASGDWFGWSVSISDDKIVVGAYNDDDNGSYSGSAYIFNSDGSYVTKITAPDGDSGDYFGGSVAISGDKIVVGAYGDADNGSYSGSAYIYNSDGSYVTKITAPDGDSGDYFGGSVAISQDKIVVGANYDDDNGSGSGSAYIFGTDGSYVAKITAPDGASGDWFGWSVAISGDKIVVGAYGDDDNGSDSGSAYIYKV